MRIELKPFIQAARESKRKSFVAGAATTATLMACGQVEQGNVFAPLNDVAHIAWGEEAHGQDAFSVKYTLVGAALSASSVGGWAAMHEWLCGRAQDEGVVAWPLLGGALVALVAYVFDYKIAPPRLMPGFERRLSNRSMLVIYAVLALSLGLSRRRA